MSYAAIAPSAYTELYPNSPTYAGSLGWKKSYMPNWAENPRRAGPSSIGETEAERNAGLAIAAAAASAAANRASENAGISASAAETVKRENATITDSADVVQARAASTTPSKVPMIAVAVSCVAGIGLIGYAMKKRG